jgi:pimeloyl-ACP methyl ester carboxylesterase
MGHISQMVAALTHHCDPYRLRLISKSIPKVVIVTGDEDHLVSPHHSQELKDSMPSAELVQWEGTGHGISSQWPKRFNELLEKTFREGLAKSTDEAGQ